MTEIQSISPETAKLRISTHKVDVGIVEDMMNMFREIQDFHKTDVDILVSNAGYGKRIVDVWFVFSLDCDEG